jgi:hypothetical protein
MSPVREVREKPHEPHGVRAHGRRIPPIETAGEIERLVQAAEFEKDPVVFPFVAGLGHRALKDLRDTYASHLPSAGVRAGGDLYPERLHLEPDDVPGSRPSSKLSLVPPTREPTRAQSMGWRGGDRSV